MPSINVKIIRVAYPPATSDPDAWYILVTDQGACKGRIPWRPNPDDSLILEGDWTTYRGEREFSFKSAAINVPTDPRDMLRYVSERTPGMGPAMESTIWATLGAGWMKAQPGDVPRLSGKLMEEFRRNIELLATKGVEANTIATLMGKGCTMNMACAAWAMWGPETIGIVNSDPFRLAELANYGFRDVDTRVRQHFGIENNDTRRIRAGVVYCLRRLTDQGDTLVEWESLYTQAVGLLGGHSGLISECTKELFENGTLKSFPECRGVALAKDWAAEDMIWNEIVCHKEGVEK
jgi:exodeoxyribonuclease V alpha subunit